MPFKIILLGKLGCGKGTQADILSKKLKVPAISTGNIYRKAIAEETEIGLLAKKLIDAGNLMPDDMTNQLMTARLKESDCAGGYIIDGYPRNIAQAEFIAPHINTVINFEIEDEAVVERLAGRRVHKASGRVYHVKYSPPKIEGLDDITGEPLMQRADDQPDVIRRRIAVYHEQSSAVAGYYRARGFRVIDVDGARPIHEVANEIDKQLLGT